MAPVDSFHHFTVDVEEYFHPTALVGSAPMASWEGFPRRSSNVIPKILDLLAEHGARGTFFVLGWLGKREPGMVRAIADAGHEVASHSWDHRLVYAQDPDQFRSSVHRTRELLQDLTGQPVLGFRAPSFSITPGTEWALDVLLDEGYRYDSSLFPISQHPTYGYPKGERDPGWIHRPGGSVLEIPPSTLKAMGSVIPAAGGAYLRFFPYALVRAALHEAERRSAPGTVYIHTWELDDYVPQLRMPRLTRLRTFGGLPGARAKTRRLLADFAFRPIAETFERMKEGSQRPWNPGPP